MLQASRAVTCWAAAAALVVLGPAGCEKKNEVKQTEQVPEVDRPIEYEPVETPGPGPGYGDEGGFAAEPPEATEPPSETAQDTRPEPLETSPETEAPRFHVVRKDDTLWSMAKEYLGSGKRWKEISEANGGLDPQKLMVGQKIIIPQQ